MKELKKKTVRADTDGLYYYREDTYWICEPSFYNPGIIAPCKGAVPTDEQILVN